MLTLALVATVAGFILLVVGLVTGIVWLAVACIVVCVLGLLLLLVDVLGWGRRDDDTPKFTIRTPEETGADDVAAERAGIAGPTGAATAGAASAATSDGPPQAWSAVPEGQQQTDQPPIAPQTPVGEPSTSPAPLAAHAPQPDVPATEAGTPGGGVAEAGAPEGGVAEAGAPEGGVADYVRSVTGPIDLAALARRRAEAAGESTEDPSAADAEAPQPQDEHTDSAQSGQDR